MPHEKGTGCIAVKHSVQTQREKNKRVYGLLDGEASVSYDGYSKFKECTEPFFEVDGLDGIMFLAEHEAENILLNYADVVTYIENDATLPDLGKRSPIEIEAKIEEVVERHFWAAMCKYVSYEMHKANLIDGVLANTFHTESSLCRSMQSIKDNVTGKNGDWRIFMLRLKELRRGTESYLQSLSPAASKKARRRLTDGKKALDKIRSIYGLRPTWQGHLAKEVASSGYSATFRDRLFRRTEITN